MEHESLLPCSQKPSTGPHPEPDHINNRDVKLDIILLVYIPYFEKI
jgi:hypothetical protein